MALPEGHRLFSNLRELGEHVGWVDEHRTSMCCSECESEMEPATIHRKAIKPRTRVRCIPFTNIPASSTTSTNPSHFQASLPHVTLPCPRPLHHSRMKGTADTVSPWGLRVCFSEQCRERIWCRDVCACRNMLTRVGCAATSQRRYFRWSCIPAPSEEVSSSSTTTTTSSFSIHKFNISAKH
jgi:hypothetical protein